MAIPTGPMFAPPACERTVVGPAGRLIGTLNSTLTGNAGPVACPAFIPAPVIVAQPVWVPGFWAWNGVGWVWVPGRWAW